jgi:hypothetical protein
MKDRLILIRFALAACLVALAFNCSGGGDDAGSIESAADDVKKAGTDLAGAVENVVEDAGEEAAGAVSTAIDEIKAAIADKEGALEAIKAKLANLKPAEMTGETASKLKKESEGLTKELEELKGKLAAAMESH